jgi:hypothetical protein
MGILLGALLGGAAVAGLQAAVVLYALLLIVAALVTGTAPVLVLNAVWAAPQRRKSIVLGVVLGAGALASLWAARALLGSGNDVHFFRPLVPALLAAPLAVFASASSILRALRAKPTLSDLARAAWRTIGILLIGISVVVFAAAVVLASGLFTVVAATITAVGISLSLRSS